MTKNIETKLHMESFSLNGREKDVKFGKTKEILD